MASVQICMHASNMPGQKVTTGNQLGMMLLIETPTPNFKDTLESSYPYSLMHKLVIVIISLNQFCTSISNTDPPSLFGLFIEKARVVGRALLIIAPALPSMPISSFLLFGLWMTAMR